MLRIIVFLIIYQLIAFVMLIIDEIFYKGDRQEEITFIFAAGIIFIPIWIILLIVKSFNKKYFFPVRIGGKLYRCALADYDKIMDPDRNKMNLSFEPATNGDLERLGYSVDVIEGLKSKAELPQKPLRKLKKITAKELGIK